MSLIVFITSRIFNFCLHYGSVVNYQYCHLFSFIYKSVTLKYMPGKLQYLDYFRISFYYLSFFSCFSVIRPHLLTFLVLGVEYRIL